MAAGTPLRDGLTATIAYFEDRLGRDAARARKERPEVMAGADRAEWRAVHERADTDHRGRRLHRLAPRGRLIADGTPRAGARLPGRAGARSRRRQRPDYLHPRGGAHRRRRPRRGGGRGAHCRASMPCSTSPAVRRRPEHVRRWPTTRGQQSGHRRPPGGPRSSSRYARLVVASSMSIYGEGLYAGAGRSPRRVDAHAPSGSSGRRLGADRAGRRAADTVPTPEDKPAAPARSTPCRKLDQERMCLMLGRGLRHPHAWPCASSTSTARARPCPTPIPACWRSSPRACLNGPPAADLRGRRGSGATSSTCATSPTLARWRWSPTPRWAKRSTSAAARPCRFRRSPQRMAKVLGRAGLEPEILGRYRAGRHPPLLRRHDPGAADPRLCAAAHAGRGNARAGRMARRRPADDRVGAAAARTASRPSGGMAR